MLNSFFKIHERHSSISREVSGGLTTFLTMCYIIFVQPVILSEAGMDRGAVMVATCISSALACILMGFLANYPIALAPAMGHNVFFAFGLCVGMGISWQVALGANFISGLIFIGLSIFGFRVKIMDIIPSSLRLAIAAGIGLLITLLGLQWAGIIINNQAVLVQIGDLTSGPTLVALFGLILASALIVLKVPGALLISILASTVLGLVLKMASFHGLVSAPPSIQPTLFALDIKGVFMFEGAVAIIFTFFFLDLFDTIGTLIGVAERGNLLEDGKLPKANRALMTDAIGTVSGTLLGTSTVTSYIESTTGITAGARTGLAAIVTGILFLAALFFSPLIELIGGTVMVGELALHPFVAPVLILVGAFMMRCVRKIDWDDMTEAIPAFLTMVVMAFSINITEGIAFGFIAYALLKIITGRYRDAHWILHLCALAFILRYIFLT